MDFQRGVLEILLRRIRFESVSLHTSRGENDYRGAKQETFLQAARVHLPYCTEDENLQLYAWAKGQLFGTKTEGTQEQPAGVSSGIFGMIADVAGEFLEIKDGRFYYRSRNWTGESQFFHWKELAAGLGQEVFLMALLAQRHVNGTIKEPGQSGWPAFLCQPFPQVADQALGSLLGQNGGKGLAENHFHLKGSFPVFLLNWTCLMNHVGEGKDFFRRMKEYREVEQLTEAPDTGRQSLFQAAVAAAGYRLHLFEIYSGIPEGARMPFSYDADPDETDLGTLQRQIEYYRSNPEPYWDGEEMVFAPDYGLADQWVSCREQDEVSIAGERYFLYRCFREIFKKESCFGTEEKNLFYKYLLISFRIRGELVQTNQARGFGNFAAYQDRKEDIIDHYPEYESHIIRLTACSLRRWQNLSGMEMRISPKPSASETLNRIAGYRTEIEKRVLTGSRGADQAGLRDYCFLLHFPKEREEGWSELEPRDFLLRQKMDRQMEEQKQLIRSEQSDFWYMGIQPMVRGYDTCSGEIGCRPEVFARFYRGIRSFAEEIGADWIHWTYHVGEDFLDLTDGLRAIDEAVRFCALPPGSRLGHGMALGLDTARYYQMKQWKLLLPRQDLLDNIAWTLGFCQESGIVIEPILRKKLEAEFGRLHEKIYGAVPKKAKAGQKTGQASVRTGEEKETAAGDNWSQEEGAAEREAAYTRIDEEGFTDRAYENGRVSDSNGRVSDSLDWQPYYSAWKLRGDWPEVYKEGEEVRHILLPEAALREGVGEELDKIRRDKVCRDYYKRYHFSRQVRKKGEQPEPFTVDRRYVDLIEKIQEELRYGLTKKDIRIECNPTSNYKIGPFDRFDRHPMLRMYGKNLEEGAASRMCISINTDDMGVFQTSLETEYAAMYVALQKCRDEQGRFRYPREAVLKWLEDVKAFGHQQAFTDKINTGTG